MKKCKFCDTDISNLRSNATICGSKECKRAYDKWRKSLKKEDRFCEICGTNINHLAGQRKICESVDCINEQKRRKYASTLKEKSCARCGEIFLATLKQTMCENCRTIRNNSNYQMLEQQIVCKRCGKLIKTTNKVINHKTKDILIGNLCEDCSIISKEELIRKNKWRMIVDNPMWNDDIKYQSLYNAYITKHSTKNCQPLLNFDEYVELVKKNVEFRQNHQPETKEETILRMKTNNPMFNELTKQKVSQTIKTKIRNRELVYKKGIEHHLWKGNRNFNKSVRIALRQWVKECFKKQNFTCQHCGKTHTELHVHHITHLRDIINKIIINNNLDIFKLNEICGTNEYFNIIQQVVDYHNQMNDNEWIVVCPNCHHELDKYYRRKVYDNTEINKNKI